LPGARRDYLAPGHLPIAGPVAQEEVAASMSVAPSVTVSSARTKIAIASIAALALVGGGIAFGISRAGASARGTDSTAGSGPSAAAAGSVGPGAGSSAGASASAVSPGAVSIRAGKTAEVDQVADGWLLNTIKIDDDGTGHLHGVATLTNTIGSPTPGSFTVNVFVGNVLVGSLGGAVGTTPTGSRIVLEMTSGEAFVTGPYTIDFQSNL